MCAVRRLGRGGAGIAPRGAGCAACVSAHADPGQQVTAPRRTRTGQRMATRISLLMTRLLAVKKFEGMLAASSSGVSCSTGLGRAAATGRAAEPAATAPTLPALLPATVLLADAEDVEASAQPRACVDVGKVWACIDRHASPRGMVPLGPPANAARCAPVTRSWTSSCEPLVRSMLCFASNWQGAGPGDRCRDLRMHAAVTNQCAQL